jgi:hypothetical protein
VKEFCLLQNRTRLIRPPQEEREVYPFRLVWNSVITESVLLLIITLLIFVGLGLLNISLPPLGESIVKIALVFLPVVAWAVFSLLPEQRAVSPRKRILAVMLLGGLIATGITTRLVYEVFQIDRWLPVLEGINRIIGYIFTLGIVQVVACYLIVHYMVALDLLRVRQDAIAYTVACAVGYSVAFNFDNGLTTNIMPDILAIQVFFNYSLTICGALIIAYGMAETRIARAPSFLLVSAIFLGAILVGLGHGLASNLSNASLTLTTSTPTTIATLGIGAVFLFGSIIVVRFLVANAERREVEASEKSS